MALISREEKRNYLTYYKSKEDLIEDFLDMEERYGVLYEGFAKATKEIEKRNREIEEKDKQLSKIYKFVNSDEFGNYFDDSQWYNEVIDTIKGIIEE